MAGCVATIGFFDGVHRGHQYVISRVADEARRRGLRAVVVTFDRHPREVLSGGGGPALLTSLEDKRRLIVEAGADSCEVLHFDRDLAALTAREFMESVLRRRLGVEVLLLGYDNRFGRKVRQNGTASGSRTGQDAAVGKAGAEGFDDYVAYGRELGIEVVRLELFQNISSSAIRQALGAGDVAQASALLGRRYWMTGTVVHGFGEGRKLGFPTANLDPASIVQLLPGRGVYAVKAGVASEPQSTLRWGMMNIGVRPTFGGDALTVEVHLLDFDGDLYGQELRVEVVERIREEHRFSSPEELRRQLEQDRAACWKEGDKAKS